MGDHDHRAHKVQQKVLQPVDGVDVQAVGGLVQEDDVRAAEEGLGQQHLDLDLFGQAGHPLVEQLGRQAQPLQDLLGLGLGLPAAELGELPLQFGGEDAVLLREVGLLVELVLLLHDFKEPGVALQNGV